jgi:hypothetical protein
MTHDLIIHATHNYRNNIYMVSSRKEPNSNNQPRYSILDLTFLNHISQVYPYNIRVDIKDV